MNGLVRGAVFGVGTWNHHQLKPVVHECEVASIAGILSRQGVVNCIMYTSVLNLSVKKLMINQP